MLTDPHPLWPLFDLRIRSERLILRTATDDALVELAALAKAGIHPPDEMPFAAPWSTRPSPAFEREFVQYHWRQRATWTADEWELPFGVELDGRLVGLQAIYAHEFPATRTVGSGSWLGRAYQGRGIGKEMRAAVLAFAFETLGAEIAITEATVQNTASNGVSRSLGYQENGFGRLAPGGQVKDTVRYRMTREQWGSRPRPPIVVEGFERCRDLFGLDGPAGG